MFPIRKKWNFEPTGNLAHTTLFLTLGKFLLILITPSFQMLIMQISTQTDNDYEHDYD